MNLVFNHVLVYPVGILFSFVITYFFKRNFLNNINIYQIILTAILIPLAIILPDYMDNNFYPEIDIGFSVWISIIIAFTLVFLIIYLILAKFKKRDLQPAFVLAIMQLIMVYLPMSFMASFPI